MDASASRRGAAAAAAGGCGGAGRRCCSPEKRSPRGNEPSVRASQISDASESGAAEGGLEAGRLPPGVVAAARARRGAREAAGCSPPAGERWRPPLSLAQAAEKRGKRLASHYSGSARRARAGGASHRGGGAPAPTCLLQALGSGAGGFLRSGLEPLQEWHALGAVMQSRPLRIPAKKGVFFPIERIISFINASLVF